MQKIWTSDFEDIIHARPSGAVLAVCLHPALDVTVHTKDGKETEKTVSLGGKAINLARMLHTLGVKVTLMAPDDRERQTSNLLAGCGFDCELIPTSLSLRHNYKYIDADGTHRECNGTAGNISPQEYAQVFDRIINICRTQKFSHVALCGSFPQGVEKAVYKSLTEQLKAQHIACVVDAFGDALSLAVQAKPLLIKPNLEEFCTSFSQDISLLKTEKDTCKAIFAAYKRTDVQILCSMDKRGAIYAGGKGLYLVQSPIVEHVRGFAGAGDTMLAAFLYAKELCSMPIEQALRFASAVATAKVRLPAGQLPNTEQIHTAYIHTNVQKGLT